MGLIGAIILGLLAGFIANKLMGKDGGLLWDLLQVEQRCQSLL